MSALSSPSRTENKILRIYWNDGLLDLLAGVGVCLIGTAWLFDLVPLGAVAPAVLLPFWKVLRGRITEPRLGFVELSDRQQHRHQNFLWLSVALGGLTLLIGLWLYLVVVRLPGEFHIGIAGLPAIILAGLALLTAAATSLNRFLLYAILLVICGVAVTWLDQDPGWALLAGGLAMVVSGAISLSRFLVRYPLDSESPLNSSSTE